MHPGSIRRQIGRERHSLAGYSVVVNTHPAIVDFLKTVDRAALDSNVSVMADWARSAGVRLAPHGKTTMAPQVWAQQLDAGAWGITLATPCQVQLARSFGVGRIMLANAIVDPVALAWLATELDADPSFEFFGWAAGDLGS